MEEFTLRGEYIELVKLAKAVGWCSTGGMAKLAIADGLIKVDGKLELRKRCKIKKGQVVSFQKMSIIVV